MTRMRHVNYTLKPATIDNAKEPWVRRLCVAQVARQGDFGPRGHRQFDVKGERRVSATLVVGDWICEC